VARRAARAADTHEELRETVVELLDVSEYPHVRMVVTAGAAVHAGFGGGVYCMDMANKLGARKLSLRQLWVIYKQTAVARGFGSSRRELAVAHVAFYSAARGALKELDYMLENGEQDTALRTIRRFGRQIKVIQANRPRRKLQ